MTTDQKVYGIDATVLSDVLGFNQFWTGNGPNGETPLTDGERITAQRGIAKDLKALHFDNGDEWFSEFWVILKNELVRCNWLAKCGPYALKNVMIKKAKKLASQRISTQKPVLVYNALDNALKDFK